jgi:iron complex transport system substrate-binding protein
MGTRRALVGGLLAVLAGAGCAAGAEPPPGTGARVTEGVTAAQGVTAYPLTVDNCGMQVTFEAPPSRVMILGDVTVGEVETFVMLGLQDRILANTQVTGVSDHPELAERVAELPTEGLEVDGSFAVPSEQVLALQPDLVVGARSATFDPDRGSPGREELAEAGIASLVNPAGCAGAGNATADQRAALATRTVESSYELVRLLGAVFDVPAAAEALVADLSERIAATERAVEGREPRRMLLAYPGMSMMNANGLPGMFAGGIYDDVVRRAGGVNVLEGETLQSAASINEEHLAVADVEVLLVGQFLAGEDPAAEAERLFARFPEWDASRTRTYVVVSDGPEIGPVNAWAIEKIARVAHPDAF